MIGQLLDKIAPGTALKLSKWRFTPEQDGYRRITDEGMLERVQFDNDFHLNEIDDESPINWKTL